MRKSVHVGKERAGSFLCSVCRHYFPKADINYLKQKRKFKVCKDCFEEMKK